MMKHIIILAILLNLFSNFTIGQEFDTLRVMSYNILYYGETTSFCTSSNNPIAEKDAYFEIIAKYVKPDVLVVNELGASNVYANRILNNVLNTGGQSNYQAATIRNNSFSSIVNGIFYRGDKLSLVSHRSVKDAANGSQLVRVIDIAQFYYRDPELASGSDTVFLYVLAAHLKAGDSSSDRSARDLATEALMEEISSNYPPGYYLLCGDFNMKNSNEAAYSNLVAASNQEYRFVDPIGEEGNWNNNASFSEVHTQSTRNSSTNGGCFSGGGMDDRFDLILASDQVIQDTGAVRYISGSYSTVGQDGNHFNQAINSGSNSSVSSTVLGALYEMSDHLPVRLDLKIELLAQIQDTTDTTGDTTNISGAISKPQSKVWFQSNELRIQCFAPRGGMIEVFNINGQLVGRLRAPYGYSQRSLKNVNSGLYLIRTTTEQGVSTQRLWIPNT
ncbi:MAG: hypothetical protein Salg2KO_09770 [Salibacteraceae bacterium]